MAKRTKKRSKRRGLGGSYVQHRKEAAIAMKDTRKTLKYAASALATGRCSTAYDSLRYATERVGFAWGNRQYGRHAGGSAGRAALSNRLDRLNKKFKQRCLIKG